MLLRFRLLLITLYDRSYPLDCANRITNYYRQFLLVSYNYRIYRAVENV